MNSFFKRMLCLILSLCLLLPPALTFTVSADVYESGNYEYYTDGLYAVITLYKGSESNVAIPSQLDGLNVTEVAPAAFRNNSSIVSVTFPSTLTSISNSPTSVSGAFYNCVNLKQITFSQTAALIGSYAFYNCTSLTDISFGGVNEIGAYAFYSCTSLSNVTITSGLKIIDGTAFLGCSSLASYSVNSGNTSFSASDGVLFNKSMSSLRNYPPAKTGAYSIPSLVTSIAPYAFFQCNNLTVTLPSGVTALSSNTFYGCTGKLKVTIPSSVSSISSNAFYNCEFLILYVYVNSAAETFAKNRGIPAECVNYTVQSSYFTYSVAGGKATVTGYTGNHGKSVTIPDTLGGYPVVSVTSSAFKNNAYITGITFPASLTSIASGTSSGGAFSGCPYLMSVTFNGSAASIGDYAFYSCPLLDGVTLGGNITSLGIGAFEGCVSIEEITLPQSISSISSRTFASCQSLKSVILPQSITSIGSYAFYLCESLESFSLPSAVTFLGVSAFESCSALKNLTLSPILETISPYAFYYCVSLKNISIPAKVDNIGRYAFSGCTTLEGITVDPSNTVYCAEENVLLNKNKTILYQYSTAREGGYEVPASVTVIDDFAFYLATKLTEVALPQGLLVIGSKAFSDCSSLTRVNLPGSINTLGSSVFYKCEKLASVDLSDLKAGLSDWIFAYCHSLKSLSVPSTVSDIGSYAFYNSGLESIDIANGINSIGAYAFYGCVSLESIVIPKSVNNLPEGMFLGCTGLKTAVIGNNVSSIGKSAFHGCSGLSKAELPASVKTIGDFAFAETHPGIVIYTSYGSYAESYAHANGMSVVYGSIFPTGATLLGKIKSYNPNIATDLCLMQGEEIKYQTKINSMAGSGQITQSFSFQNVLPGEYSIVIQKPGHTKFTINNVIVSETDIDLEADSRAAVQCITLRTGDLNSDGVVTMDDLLILLSSSNYNKAVSSALNSLTDINGDGFVTMDDLLTLLSAANYNGGGIIVN